MKLKHYTCGFTLALGLAIVIVCPSVEAPAKSAAMADPGPLKEALAAICGEPFDAKRHQIISDANGVVTGCELRAPKVAAK
ncbi:hypothetical protein RD110_15775 [Rhodoferax koreense]|uniref:DUF1161 domain-containing protein n=1 Tax=Rhodoferax koreensis TaxID=1842727 RepID=A0A1P8JXJ7_9BURK|nr:hypothetical protein [Rhodoferax koreense]APW38480.1 hypothetical protein RD110_15775 [Rhodoferax koreense]